MKMIKLKTIVVLTVIVGTISAQNVGINTDGSLPGMMLDIKVPSGDDGIRINNNSGTGDAMINLQDGGTSVWTFGLDASNGNRLVFSNGGALSTTNFVSIETTGDVGIGINNPTAMLTVNADATFNESGGSNDFRIESNTQVNAFFVDGSADFIGIRSNAPTSMLYMTNNGAAVGANSMASFDNGGTTGVTISGQNSSTSNPYNAIEGLTYGQYSGVFGLGVSDDNGSAYDATGVYGHANDYQGLGVYGVRSGTGGPDNGFGGLFIADLGYTGWFGNASDARLKTNVANIETGLGVVLKLNPVSYKFNTSQYPNMGLNTEMEYGFIAQEVDSILPEIVRIKQLDVNATLPKKMNSQNESQKEDFMMVSYIQLIPILTKAIQEQQEIIEELKKRIVLLESK